MVNLTILAPDIVVAILDDTLPEEVTLFDVAAGTPALWEVQRGRFERNRGNEIPTTRLICAPFEKA